MTIDALTLAPTICTLLGGGDAALAYARLQQHLIESSHERSIKAVSASLGFSSDGYTHLDRLTDAGEMLSVDQRHARRLSDEGLVMLARLITTNWTIEATPELVVDVIAEHTGVAIMLQGSHPASVTMRVPLATVYLADERTSLPLQWTSAQSEDDDTVQLRLSMPIRLTYDGQETSLTVQWFGEIWPKLSVRLHGGASPDAVETLGNRLLLRLWSAAA